ncbi:MAG TPA: hypothetical protein VFW07_01435 [Parafilimonas sp.]|nr:hypothetical protein [Parafilimonas sp.]
MTTIASKKEYSLELAPQLKEKYLSRWDYLNQELMEQLNSLGNDDDFTSTWEPFLDLHNFATEIACLLTNPKISKKLSSYTQKHAGKMLEKMLWFFERMQDEEMYMLLLYYRLINSYGEAKESDLEWISKLIKG